VRDSVKGVYIFGWKTSGLTVQRDEFARQKGYPVVTVHSVQNDAFQLRILLPSPEEAVPANLNSELLIFLQQGRQSHQNAKATTKINSHCKT
jgi:hypothetical protein